MSSAAAVAASSELQVTTRKLGPAEVQIGCIWIGPHPGLPERVIRGQDAADGMVAAALAAGERSPPERSHLPHPTQPHPTITQPVAAGVRRGYRL